MRAMQEFSKGNRLSSKTFQSCFVIDQQITLLYWCQWTSIRAI